jgi:putative Mg2+ transporter-C (MgtC) family protein
VHVSTGNFYFDCVIRIAASFFCGFLLGLERKTRQHTVGLRTLILISMSCTLMCIISYYSASNSDVPGGDPTRITAGVVTGIGFLGGGAIMRQGLNIRGLTSAAVIWTAAALGLACGTGLFIPAAIVLAISLSSLILLEKVEWRFFPAEKTKTIRLEYSGSSVNTALVRKVLTESGFVMRDMNIDRSLEKDRTVFEYSVKAPSEIDSLAVCRRLEDTGSLLNFRISD